MTERKKSKKNPRPVAAESADFAATGIVPDILATPEGHSSLELLAKTFHASPSMIAVSTIAEGIHLDVNRTWLRTMGRERDEVIGKPVDDLDVWADRADRQRFVEKLGREGRVRDFDSRFNVAGGRIARVSISAEPIEVDGRPCMVIVGHDVSDRKKAEAALIEAKYEAERANELKSRLLANVSHELRTPLNAIIGFSDLMRRQIWGELGARQYETYVEDIHASGRHLLAIVNDLLDLSRIDAGELRLDPRPLSVPTVVDACLKIVAPQSRERRIVIETDVPADLAVTADETRLRQVLINLLSNAIKFSEMGGKVRIEAAARERGGIRIRVADSGIGMSADELEIALSPFGQAGKGSVPAREGAGLGLPLAKLLVEEHGGRIKIVSEPGQGTTISVHLPGTPASDSSLDR